MKYAIKCDQEVGSPKKGWHQCGRKAVCQSVTERFGTYLNWCDRHRKHATEPGRKLVTEY